MPEAKRSEEVPSETAFSVVGIGASAGGIEACSTLLAALPTDISAAFVVIQHIAADEPSMLSEVLARASDFPLSKRKKIRPYSQVMSMSFLLIP